MMMLFVAAMLAVPGGDADGQEKKTYRMLYITQSKGFQHGSVRRKDGELAPSEVAVTEVGKRSGLFEVECTQDASVLTAEKLKDLDLVMFYTTGNLPISEENWAAFEAWLRSGKAMIAAHAATDTFHNFKPYHSLINGTFAGHPWGSGETVTLAIHDPSHAAVKMLGTEFVIKDEIYQYRNYDPAAVRVLYSLDMSKCRTKRPYHVPVCWVRESGKGRLFYTNLGHNEGTWTNPAFQDHLLAGIRWALRLEEGSAEPNPDVQLLEQAKAFVATVSAETGRDGAALTAALAKADPAWLAGFVSSLEEFKKFGNKDEEKRKALVERLLGDLEKKSGS